MHIIYIFNKPFTNFGKTSRGRLRGLSKLFKAPVYWAHRAVVFAIARLSCVICCRNLDITFVWQKNVGCIPHEVPTPNRAHALVSACHKRRNIRSYRLTTCYGLHQKTSLVSIRAHSSTHSGDSSTQRPTLPSWPSIWSFT